MPAPYQAPATGVDLSTSETANKQWKLRQLLTAIAAALATTGLAVISIVMLMQALRLGSESASLPARFQAEYASTATSSWIAAAVALAGSLLNLGGLWLVRKNKLTVPVLFFAASMIGIMAVGIIFKPS